MAATIQEAMVERAAKAIYDGRHPGIIEGAKRDVRLALAEIWPAIEAAQKVCGSCEPDGDDWRDLSRALTALGLGGTG